MQGTVSSSAKMLCLDLAMRALLHAMLLSRNNGWELSEVIVTLQARIHDAAFATVDPSIRHVQPMVFSRALIGE